MGKEPTFANNVLLYPQHQVKKGMGKDSTVVNSVLLLMFHFSVERSFFTALVTCSGTVCLTPSFRLSAAGTQNEKNHGNFFRLTNSSLTHMFLTSQLFKSVTLPFVVCFIPVLCITSHSLAPL